MTWSSNFITEKPFRFIHIPRCAAAHLGIWMKRKGFSVMKLDDQVIGEFARHLPSCRCLGKNRGIYDDAVIGARHFLNHLRDIGVAPARAPLEKPPLPTLIDGFERWMRQHRGVSESTLTTYRLILTKLLGAVGETPCNYNAHVLRRGVEMQTSRCGRRDRKSTRLNSSHGYISYAVFCLQHT